MLAMAMQEGLLVRFHDNLIIQMLKLHLLLFLLACTATLRIQRIIPVSSLQQAHGWVILAGEGIDLGSIQLQAQIEIISDLYQPNGYKLEVLLLTYGQLQMQKSSHCSIDNRQLGVQVKLARNRNEASYKAGSKYKGPSNVNEFMFVVLRDCTHTLIKQYFQKNANIIITVSIVNNQTNISQAQWYCQWLTICTLLANTYLAFNLYKVSKIEDANIVTQYVLFIFILAVLANLWQELIHISHFLYGHHHQIIFWMQILTKGVNNAIFQHIFLNIALGWTIRANEQQIFSSWMQKIIFVCIQIVLSGLSFTWYFDFAYEDWTQLAIETINFIFLITVICIVALKLRLANIKSRRFYMRMILIVTLKIITSNFICLFLPKQTFYMNRQAIQAALLFLDLLANFAILRSFIGPSSAHFKIWLRNKSFMQ